MSGGARPDMRIGVAFAVVAAAAFLGLGLSAIGMSTQTAVPAVTAALANEAERTDREDLLRKRFEQAAALLHTRRYAQSVAALREVLELAPALPEAHANMGYALVGMDRYPEACLSFQRALDLNPRQMNAYYGLALCHEHAGDLDAALGAMRVFVHLTDHKHPHVRKAWAAIWEWQTERDGGEG